MADLGDKHAISTQSQAEIRPNEPSDTLLTQQEIPRQTQNSPAMLPNLERYHEHHRSHRMSLRQLFENLLLQILFIQLKTS